MSGHTDGPWFVVHENLPNSARSTRIVGEDTVIALVKAAGGAKQANARLIAKAWLIPDLLEQLQHARWYVVDLIEGLEATAEDETDPEVAEKIRTQIVSEKFRLSAIDRAIAKAEDRDDE